MSGDNGLVCAYIKAQDEKWREIAWEDIRKWQPGGGLLWIHFDRAAEQAKAWLQKESGLDPVIWENLLAEETRPRALEIDGNLLINLRGVNLNPGADPEDMVSLRLWLEPERIVTTRRRHIMAVNDIRERIARGRGPQNTGDFLVEVAARLVDRMSPVIEGLDETGDDLEDQVVIEGRQEIRARLAALRRQAISLRRYLAPQREAMSRIQGEPVEWIDARQKARLREISDRTMRYVEDLDSIRERAAVIQDEVANRISELINRNMYMLAIVATILLPLSFVTGLLGINVDGLPGAKDAPWAFWGVTGILAVMILAEVFILRRLKWL